MKGSHIKLLFSVIVIALLGVSVVTYRNLNNYMDEVMLIRQSNRIIRTTQLVLSTIKDAEIGHRGFQLTRDTLYLDPYYSAITVLPDELKLLDSLVLGSETQSKNVDTLSSLVQNQFLIISNILSNAQRSTLYMDAFERNLLARSKENMDAIRNKTRNILDEEQRVYQARVDSESKYQTVTPVWLLVSTVLALSGVTFLFIRILQALKKREVAEGLLKVNLKELQREVGVREFAEKTIRNIIDNSPFEIMAFKSVRNSNGEIEDFEWIFANDASAKARNIPEHELVGKRLLDVMPEVKDDLFHVYTSVVENSVSEQLEKVHTTNGSTRWLQITVIKLEDGFIVTSSDITNQKLQTALIEEREILLREAESLGRMGSWKWTESNNELVWSENLYKIYHKGPGESISWNTFLENVFQEDIRLVESFLLDVKADRMGSAINYRVMEDGKMRYLSLTVKPHTILNMDILGAVVDITEHKEYEKQLEQYNLSQSRIIKELDEKEKKYRVLFERSIDPIFLATDKLELTDVNDSFLKFFQYSPIEIALITFDTIFASVADYEYFKSTLNEIEQIKDFEVFMITKNGEKKSCLINCVFIPDQASGYYCYQGIIRDLTLRKQAESDMLIAERLSLTGKIARTIAHEVRNPLTNLNLALDQLRIEIPADNESAKLYGDIIERNANRIEQLVGEMLNSSRPKQLHLELITVPDIISDTVKLAIDRINLNQIKLVTNFQENLPRLLVDKDKIQIALLNIIINAIESMVPGEGVLQIGSTMKDKILTIFIADNGKGIPAADMEKLFDPFFTGKQSGMGLGLTSTKNILNSHSARIDVKSEVNKGTTFYINFKLAE